MLRTLQLTKLKTVHGLTDTAQAGEAAPLLCQCLPN